MWGSLKWVSSQGVRKRRKPPSLVGPVLPGREVTGRKRPAGGRASEEQKQAPVSGEPASGGCSQGPEHVGGASALSPLGSAGNENKAARPPLEEGRSEPQETADSAKLSLFFSSAQQFSCHGKQKMYILIPSSVWIVLSSGSGL